MAAFSRWMQRAVNARKVRDGRGTIMGMEVLVLNTVGRRTGRHPHPPPPLPSRHPPHPPSHR
ncbi:hypothetical protein Ait01nite_057810 [Actinoplanes italicus]|uniref:Uncharacterized protein n=1 Tax=Actinoplanes italicus TaxID=113567 RepID=A0A2T0K5S4_9ACTN|nr:hypothetical protein [Actinoplanes italicus]PRX18328.1 hypothetical protein CLV67_113162 [Actinoplanes italicus]GIE32736.1 hypothetical protein Ait01nite_057810 [Actinoplanes italicus]